MHHLWIRVLDAGALRRVRAVLRGGPARVFADTVTPEAGMILARKPLPPGVLEVVPASMAVEDENGCNIRARAEALGAALIRRAAGDPNGYRWLAPSMRPWGAEWLRVVASHYYEHGPKLSDYLAFVEIRYRTGATPSPEKLIIDLGRQEVAAVYAEYAASILRLQFPVEIRGRSPNPLAKAVHVLGRQLLQFGYLIVCWVARRKAPETKITEARKGIALVGYERGMLERLPLGATIDWYEFSNLPAERLVFLFNRSDSPLDDAVRSKLTKLGFGWVDFSSVSRLDPRAFIGSLRALLTSLRMFPAPWHGAALRRWAIVARLNPLVIWYRTFLRESRAMAFFQGTQFASSQMALNLACRQEQVAVVWSFWSVMLLLEQAVQHAFVDLLMAWGGYDLGYCRALSFDYHYAIKAGALTYDGTEITDRDRAAALRARLTAKSSFVLAIFDSAHEPRGIHHTPERCAEFYRTVLELVNDNKDWGCLIKSKATAYDDLPVQVGLQDVVRALEAEGRCMRLPNATKPTMVSLAADAIVCFSVNSAGVQGAMNTGRPVLFYDNNHLHYYPLASNKAAPRLIFRNPVAFAGAIRRLATGDRSLGDISPWAEVIDPFCDGYGRKRSAAAISRYFAARDRGASMYVALDEAVAAYRAEHGASSAAVRADVIESAGDMLWHDVRARYYAGWPDNFPYTVQQGTLRNGKVE
ncbi:MAG TPA: hypothetical protein VEU53_09945 [Stellaceae bacterium]|nr:hypothetical protein [Stellaceae bacterium]